MTYCGTWIGSDSFIRCHFCVTQWTRFSTLTGSFILPPEQKVVGSNPIEGTNETPSLHSDGVFVLDPAERTRKPSGFASAHCRCTLVGCLHRWRATLPAPKHEGGLTCSFQLRTVPSFRPICSAAWPPSASRNSPRQPARRRKPCNTSRASTKWRGFGCPLDSGRGSCIPSDSRHFPGRVSLLCHQDASLLPGFA